MTSIEQTCTGDGALDLTAYRDVYGVSFDITVVGASVQYRSDGDPRRVMHVGWISLGYEFGDGPQLSIVWSKYVEWEREGPILPAIVTCHHLIWHIETDNELHVALFY